MIILHIGVLEYFPPGKKSGKREIPRAKKNGGLVVAKDVVILRGPGDFSSDDEPDFSLQTADAFTPLRITGALKTADKTRVAHFSSFFFFSPGATRVKRAV